MSAGDKNKFDDLFKHGLDNTPEDHFEFDERDWDDMEGLLTGKKKAATVFGLRNWAIAASVLVALAIGWWFLRPEDATKQQVAIVPRIAVKKDSLVAERRVVKPAEEQSVIGSTPTNDQPLADASRSTKQAVSAATKEAQQIDKIDKISINDDKQLAAQNTLQQNTTVQQKDSSTVGQAQIGDPAVIAVVAQQSASATINEQVVAATDNAEPKENAPAVTLPKKNGSSAGEGGPVLAVSVILSPNFNGVGSLKDSKVGKTVGMMFSVGVSNKLTISTGAIYSQVPYTTAYSNYISDYNFRTTPNSVMADCRVLDIPLTVDYQVYHKGKNAFNVGAGLSSYFMLRETYSYHFDQYYPYGPSSFSVANQNKHILGVLDLSTTYQRKLNNKFSVGLQPYLKLPLTDIGNNRVRLQTAGIALTASWTIINKNP